MLGKFRTTIECSLCGVFQRDGWTTENVPGDSSDKFPAEFENLYCIARRSDSDEIYECSACGRRYLWHRSIPGGSLDAFQTYIVEALTPLSPEEGEDIVSKWSMPDAPPAERVRRCPKCGSQKVEQTGIGSIGGEVFITYTCGDCGHEATVDEYQMDDWFS